MTRKCSNTGCDVRVVSQAGQLGDDPLCSTCIQEAIDAD